MTLLLSSKGSEARVNWRRNSRKGLYREEEEVYKGEEPAFFFSLCAMEDTVRGLSERAGASEFRNAVGRNKLISSKRGDPNENKGTAGGGKEREERERKHACRESW